MQAKDGIAPGYGIGLKYKLTERFSVRVGYDIWKTPMDDGTKTDDTASDFKKLYEKCGQNMDLFIEKVKTLEDSNDPVVDLKKLTSQN